jgi:hypothetical protein
MKEENFSEFEANSKKPSDVHHGLSWIGIMQCCCTMTCAIPVIPSGTAPPPSTSARFPKAKTLVAPHRTGLRGSAPPALPPLLTRRSTVLSAVHERARASQLRDGGEYLPGDVSLTRNLTNKSLPVYFQCESINCGRENLKSLTFDCVQGLIS